MRVHGVRFDEIFIPQNRQRREFDADALVKLAGSITQNGLINPVTLRRDGSNTVLVAGERRIKAMQYIWNFGDEVRCGEQFFPADVVPALYVGEIDPVDAFEIELEENIRRTDLTWQERASATAKLLAMRRQRAEREGKEIPTVAEFANQVDGSKDMDLSKQNIRRDVILAQNLDNPVVSKARTADEAFKALKREEEMKQNARLAEEIGKTLSRSSHTLLQGNCLEILQTLSDGSFDVLLTDPPYGIDAQDFNDSGGRAGGGSDGSHFYDDSYGSWIDLMQGFIPQAFRTAKQQAHAYVFCDIERFFELRSMFTAAGWKVFRTPLIWHNPTSNRAPWPDQGPQRKWQAILYAVKGSKPATKLCPDLITFPSDFNLGHHAQKPISLFIDLLRRSTGPGSTVLDPFCGTGTIFPAAHSLKCKATGIELNPSAAGIASKRLEALK